MPILPSPRRYFVYFVLCGLGLVLASAGIIILITGMSTTTWPTTNGRIVSSGVHESTSTEASSSYSPELSYEYEVNGKTYYGFFTRMGGLSFSYEPSADSYIKQKILGSKTTVYYCPIFPALAFLETGYSFSVWIFIGVGLAFYCMSMILACVAQTNKNG